MEIGVGILGFGTVGAGVAEGLLRNRETLSRRLGVDVSLKRIADLDIKTDRGVKIPEGILTTDAMSVIHDPDIQIIVELVGGTGVAKTFIMEALKAGKNIVTANKKLLAECGEEIFDAAGKAGVDIYFGAAVGGGIPIIRVLREGLAGNEIHTIHGILNGTCNYILTRMETESLAFDDVLKAAQKAGYAEANPSLDIDGFDTAHKACILSSLAYGLHVPMDQIQISGIRDLSASDVKLASQFGYRIKLLASIRREGDEIEVSVNPTLVPFSHMLASVNNVFNAVMVNGDLSGDTLYYGRGAGRAPTASTVIGDIGDIARNIATGKARYARAVSVANAKKIKVRPAKSVSSKFYLRLMTLDRAGSLGLITTTLGKHAISVSALTQKARAGDSTEQGDHVPVVILTHMAKAENLDKALAEISQAGILSEKPVAMRML